METEEKLADLIEQAAVSCEADTDEIMRACSMVITRLIAKGALDDSFADCSAAEEVRMLAAALHPDEH